MTLTGVRRIGIWCLELPTGVRVENLLLQNGNTIVRRLAWWLDWLNNGVNTLLFRSAFDGNLLSFQTDLRAPPSLVFKKPAWAGPSVDQPQVGQIWCVERGRA